MKMPKFLKAMKVVVIHSLIFSLLQNPFISEAATAAESKSSGGGVGANDILKIANGAIDLYQNYLGQKYQMIQAQVAAANNQKLMAQLSPNCRKPDGTACYVTQAKYFPECQLPASMSNIPHNACSANSADPNAIATMITYESISKGWINYYEQMGNKNSNASYPTGVRCLLDKQKAIDSQLTEMMNNLQRLQDKLNQDKQVFRDNNKKLLEEMNTANDELFGSSKNNLALKTRDFAKYFSQSCQAVLGKELEKGSQIGLNGILQGLSTPNKSAADFTANKGSIENDIRREAEKMAQTIKANGVDDFNNMVRGNKLSAENNATFNVYGQAMMSQVAKNVSEFEIAKERIKKDLSGIKKYELPALDSRFSPDMDEFLASANQTFKQQFISDCVTGADKGIAIPVSDILNALEQRATNSEGTARNDYRVALKRILESGDSAASILEQIKELDRNYPGMTITYKDASQNRVTDTPYSLFMKTAEKCEQSYVQGDNKKVERARAALAELKTLNDSYSSKVSSAILNQLLTCNGSAMKTGSCNEAALSGGQGNPNFCVAHASQCANEIQGCYAEANAHVQTRKTKMDNLAKRFNENVAAMVARSNALYEQQKAAVTNMTKLIQQRFPGTNFEIPKDMFVSMPELKKDAFGVELAGDGKIESFLEGPNSMPEKITLLKEMFKRQQAKVKGELDEYIAGQEGAMKENIGKWERVAGECKSAIDTASANLAKANQEGQKRQAEEDGKVGEFCSRYSSLSENPLGACEDASDLATDMKKISARLDPGVAGNVNAFRQMCNQYNNESESGSESTASKKSKRAAGKAAGLKSLCVSSDGTSVKSDEDFIAGLKRVNPALRKAFKENSYVGYITGNESAPQLEDEDVKDLLDELKKDYQAGKSADAAKLEAKFKNPESYKKVSLGDSICGGLMKAQIASADNNAGFTDLTAAAGATTTFSKADNSLSLIKELASSGAGNVEELASNLGEKLSGAACDMQNKSSMPKSNFPWMNDPSSFDQKILGSNSNR